MGRYFYEALKEYADSTTIHGISYIFKNGISILERIIWIAAVVTGTIFAIYLSTMSYLDWQNSPVSTTLLTTGKPIRDIPFPAITICAQVYIIAARILISLNSLHFFTFQGMSRDIVDAAVMQQFKEYLVKKGVYVLDF